MFVEDACADGRASRRRHEDVDHALWTEMAGISHTCAQPVNAKNGGDVRSSSDARNETVHVQSGFRQCQQRRFLRTSSSRSFFHHDDGITEGASTTWITKTSSILSRVADFLDNSARLERSSKMKFLRLLNFLRGCNRQGRKRSSTLNGFFGSRCVCGTLCRKSSIAVHHRLVMERTSCGAIMHRKDS